MTGIEILSMLIFLAVFTLTAGAGVAIFFWLHRDERRAIARLRELPNEQTQPEEAPPAKPMLKQVLPSAGKLLLPQEAEQTGYWQRSLRRAGYGGPNAYLTFLGIKLVLLLTLPAVAVLVPLTFGWLPLNASLIAGTFAIAASLLGPNFWVYWRIQERQAALLRTLPDALDMLVLCLEG